MIRPAFLFWFLLAICGWLSTGCASASAQARERLRLVIAETVPPDAELCVLLGPIRTSRTLLGCVSVGELRQQLRHRKAL